MWPEALSWYLANEKKHAKELEEIQKAISGFCYNKEAAREAAICVLYYWLKDKRF